MPPLLPCIHRQHRLQHSLHSIHKLRPIILPVTNPSSGSSHHHRSSRTPSRMDPTLVLRRALRPRSRSSSGRCSSLRFRPSPCRSRSLCRILKRLHRHLSASCLSLPRMASQQALRRRSIQRRPSLRFNSNYSSARPPMRRPLQPRCSRPNCSTLRSSSLIRPPPFSPRRVLPSP